MVLCGALRESKVSKVQELDLQSNDIGVAGATAIARLCAVRASLTSCNVLYNEMDVVAAKLLADAVKEKEMSYHQAPVIAQTNCRQRSSLCLPAKPDLWVNPVCRAQVGWTLVLELVQAPSALAPR